MSKLRRDIYKTARILGTVEAVKSGSPKRMKRRAKNIVVGKVLRKTGFWKWLWK